MCALNTLSVHPTAIELKQFPLMESNQLKVKYSRAMLCALEEELWVSHSFQSSARSLYKWESHVNMSLATKALMLKRMQP